MAPPPRLLQFLAVLLFLSVVLLLLAVSGVHATRHHHADVIGGEHRVGTSYIRAPRSLAPYSVHFLISPRWPASRPSIACSHLQLYTSVVWIPPQASVARWWSRTVVRFGGGGHGHGCGGH